MVVFGFSYIYYIKVGNDYVWGVFGGEWKRVSIVEMMVVGFFILVWDNSIWGFDLILVFKFV